ncbi:putative zinc finger protein 2, partial [Triplophysa rosa]
KKTTTKAPPRAESLKSKRNISPGKMTVNQTLRFSFSTCARQTDNSSLSQQQSLNAPKLMRTCSDVVSIDKRFVCSYCSKRFRCFSQLEVHQRSHKGEKPYRCTLCGKRYAQKGHLYTHQRTHTGEKLYRCLLCGKGFIQKCTLDMHLRSHTGEKPFTCGKCGKGFTKKCNLNKHLSCQSCNS